MLSYLYQMQNNPMRIIEQQLQMHQYAAAGANMNNYGLQGGIPVNKSLGEVSFGIPAMQQQQPYLMQQQLPNTQLQQQGQSRPSPKSILVQPGRSTSASKRVNSSAENPSIGEVPSPGKIYFILPCFSVRVFSCPY